MTTNAKCGAQDPDAFVVRACALDAGHPGLHSWKLEVDMLNWMPHCGVCGLKAGRCDCPRYDHAHRRRASDTGAALPRLDGDMVAAQRWAPYGPGRYNTIGLGPPDESLATVTDPDVRRRLELNLALVARLPVAVRKPERDMRARNAATLDGYVPPARACHFHGTARSATCDGCARAERDTLALRTRFAVPRADLPAWTACHGWALDPTCPLCTAERDQRKVHGHDPS